MPAKNGTKRSAKVMETLSNAASMFQAPMLATNTGMPLDSSVLARTGEDQKPSRVGNGLRPPTSTIMCPW